MRSTCGWHALDASVSPVASLPYPGHSFRIGFHCQRRKSVACRNLRPESASGQANKFKYRYDPWNTGLPQDYWLTYPQTSEGVGLPQQRTIDLTGEDVPSPELHELQPAPGRTVLRNPHAQLHWVQWLGGPFPFMPGVEKWIVELGRDYTRGLPSTWYDDEGRKFRYRSGFLNHLDPGKLSARSTPFYLYQGLEDIHFSLPERALQLLFLAAYTAVHVAMFSYIWTQQPLLSAALFINWARGTLVWWKVGLLLLLAASGRVWLYFLFLGAQLIDKGLEKLAPPIRRFFWANFTVWVIYLIFSPAYMYPLPFPPFAPGTLGPQEAIA